MRSSCCVGAMAVLMATMLMTVPARTEAATLMGLLDTGELFASTDEGVTWSVHSALPVHDAIGLQARGSAFDLLLCSGSGIVYRSPNGGASWTAVGAIPATDVVELLLHHMGRLLLLTATGFFYESNDEGETFALIATLVGSDFVGVCESSAGSLYALRRSGGVYASADLGRNWTARGALTLSDGVGIRALGNVLFAVTEAGDVHRSSDGGTKWEPVGTLSHFGMRDLLAVGSQLVAASKEGHVWSSVDGAIWTARGSMQQLTLTALGSDVPALVGSEGFSGEGLRFGTLWPNPTSGMVTFALRLPRDEVIDLELYDVRGQLVTSRKAECFGPGTHTVTWVPWVKCTGVYVLRLRTGTGQEMARNITIVR